MQIHYASYNHFVSKAAILAHELALPEVQARALLARLSGYENEEHIAQTHGAACLPSRLELTIRLMELRPEICLLRSAAIIDSLELPMCDGADFAAFSVSGKANPGSGRHFGKG